ncbi:MAG: hypothetical protein A2W93_07165 [Bacteroidetes bacterium GWF2_43_63]|nr:MAG: hypothetical protein A2W94_15235 [Bacteroidetes bacterium GWE2_42_42]OFY54008.1 MAG: hypothetical protein A2W93_07165 [Bacteroidetes bacterium GWF2_43_63]
MNRMKNMFNKSSQVVLNAILLFMFFLASVSLKSQPANDDCTNATIITPGSSCAFNTYTNLGATASAGAPAPGCSSYVGGDVWFQTTVPSSGHLTFDSNTGGITDGGMAIYSGTCGSLTLIECDDDDSNNGLMPKIDRSGLTPGSTIYIRFWEYGGDTYGSFSLCVYDDSPPPVTNDDCSAAIPITIGSSCAYTTYSNVGATASSGAPAPGCASYSSGDVWFSCTVPASGSLSFDSQTGTLTDCGMAVYYGPCASLSLIECDDDDSPNGLMPMISRTGLTPGATVFIRFWDYGGTDFGSFGLCVYEPPTAPPCVSNPAAGDFCSTPTPICNLNGYCGSTSSTYTADIPGNLGSIFCGSIENNSWLSFVADATTATLNLFVSNCTNAWGIQMQIYSVTGCSTFTSVSNCYNPGTPVNGTVTATGLTIGQIYYVMIDGNAGDVCDYIISASSGVFTADAGPDVTICGGQNTTLNASGGSAYAWSPTTGLSNPNIANPIASPSVTTTYTVSVTGGNPLCPGTYTDQVTVFVSGITPTVSNNGPLCSGQNLNLTATPSGATSYSWSGPNGFASNSQNPSISGATPVASGTYTVTVTNGGCSGTASTTVNVSNSATVTASASPASVCLGQTSTLSALGAATYAWSSGSTTVNPTATTTYTVTGTSASGCTGTATVTVSVNSAATFTASASPTAICNGQSSSLTASGGVTYLWNTGASGSPYSVSPTTTTTYTVTGTTALGCSGTATVSVTINPFPTVTATAAASSICIGSSTSLTGGGASSYAWSTGQLINPITVSPAATSTYTVTGTSAAGCTGTATVSVNISANLLLTATATPASICLNGSSTIAASGATNYAWSPSGTGASFSATPTATTTYSVTGTDASGCTGTTTVTLTVNPLPTVSATATPATICAGQSSTIAASGANSYTWSPGGTGTSFTASPTSTTTYNVTGTTTAGCTGTTTVALTVNPLPTVTATATPAAVCAGQSSTIAVSGANTYAWSPSGAGTSFTATPASTTTYTVTGTSGAGCTGTTTVTLTINPLPTVTATATPAAICSGQSSTIAASGANSYTWSPSGTGTSFTASPTSTTTYNVTGTTSAGCTGTANVTLTVNPLPTVTATATPTSICIGGSSTIAANGANTYTWSPSGSGASFAASPTTTTTYTVTGTTAAGCTGTATATLTVNPLPNITATASPTTICIGFSSTVSGNGGTSYAWNNGQNATSFTESPTATTTYNVTGTDANNCSNTATVTVSLMPGLTVSVSPNIDDICAGGSTTLIASSPGSGVGYSWDTGANTASIIANPTATTTYSVTGTDVQGCSGTASAIVNVNPLPVVAFSADPLTGCAPASVNFSDASSGNINIWEWEFGDGNISGLQNPSHTYSSGSFSVTLTVTTTAGCQSTMTMSNYVMISANPVAAFAADPAVTTEDNPTINFINQSTGATNYTWNFGDGTGTDYAENPLYTYGLNGEFTVTLWVENAAGCADSTTMRTLVKPSYTFYLPNAFSPNGDDRNDFLRPFGTGWNMDSYSMRVYSRWGELVFLTTDINHGWDGFLPNGAEAQQGVYSVLIRVKGLDHSDNEYYLSVGLLR